MRVYISGPITNEKPGEARQKFADAEAFLRGKGWDTINPEEALRNIHLKHDEYLTINYPMLALCDAILLLRGWRSSVGACVELGMAMALCKKIYEIDERGTFRRFTV